MYSFQTQCGKSLPNMKLAVSSHYNERALNKKTCLGIFLKQDLIDLCQAAQPVSRKQAKGASVS